MNKKILMGLFLGLLIITISLTVYTINLNNKFKYLVYKEDFLLKLKEGMYSSLIKEKIDREGVFFPDSVFEGVDFVFAIKNNLNTTKRFVVKFSPDYTYNSSIDHELIKITYPSKEGYDLAPNKSMGSQGIIELTDHNIQADKYDYVSFIVEVFADGEIYSSSKLKVFSFVEEIAKERYLKSK